jgi:site-specific DNA-methyltransferase (adenine-specific)
MIEINKNYNENCLDTMGRMNDNFIDITVTSPPYGTLRKYNGFSFDFESVAKELYRVTKEGGVVVWVVADKCINGGESMDSFKQALYFGECGFRLYDTMIWNKPSPQAPTEGRYYDTFEYMFVFSKGKPKTLNLLKDRKNKTAGSVSNKESRSCREDRKILKGKRTVAEYSRRFNVWDISRGRNKTKHPAVFPEKIANDHIISWSNEGDLSYDPFMGSGTTAKTSILNNRNWIGSEMSSEYCDIIEERVKKAVEEKRKEKEIEAPTLFNELN